MENSRHLSIVKHTHEKLKALMDEVEKVKNELQEEYDKLSVDTQFSDYGYELESVIDSLGVVHSCGLDMVENDLADAVSSLELLPSCDRGEEDEEFYDEEIEDDEEEIFDDDVYYEDREECKSNFLGLSLFSRGFWGNRGNKQPEKKDNYDPYDTHWETSFDWKDEDNDGYDDRDDGFWVP
jgi:hypothetical protein